jgi:hypothetical protein
LPSDMERHKGIVLPTWAPRVKPYLIRRLYESDDQGVLDTDLLDEVGWALYARCESFIQAGKPGRVTCAAPPARK